MFKLQLSSQMTARSLFKESELKRIFRAAKAAGTTVHIDLATGKIAVFPFAPLQEQVLNAIFPNASNIAWRRDDGIDYSPPVL
jgi:hypothetical protein